jgi:hypothetical protein
MDAATGERRFQCRITNSDEVTWTVRPVGLPGRNDYAIAQGVARVDLLSDHLPWAPHPYRLDLELRVRAGGNQQITTWPLVVLPHGDDLFLPIDPGLQPAEGDEGAQ